MPKYEFKQIPSSMPGFSCASIRKLGTKQWSKLTGVFGTDTEIRNLIRSWRLSQKLNLSALKKQWVRADVLAEKAAAKANKFREKHEEAWAMVDSIRRATTKISESKKKIWRLEGYDTFSGEPYSLGGVYHSKAEAEAAARKRLKELEASQPSASSGGQGGFGIQDQVYIVPPNGYTYRFTGLTPNG